MDQQQQRLNELIQQRTRMKQEMNRLIQQHTQMKQGLNNDRVNNLIKNINNDEKIKLIINRMMKKDNPITPERKREYHNYVETYKNIEQSKQKITRLEQEIAKLEKNIVASDLISKNITERIPGVASYKYDGFITQITNTLLGPDNKNTQIRDKIKKVLENLPQQVQVRMLESQDLQATLIQSDEAIKTAIDGMKSQERLSSLSGLFDEFINHIGTLQGLIFLQGIYQYDHRTNHNINTTGIDTAYNQEIEGIHTKYGNLIGSLMSALNGKISIINDVVSQNLADNADRVNAKLEHTYNITGNHTDKVLARQSDQNSFGEYKNNNDNGQNNNGNNQNNNGDGQSGGSYKLKHLKYKLKSEIVSADLKVMSIKSKMPNLFS